MSDKLTRFLGPQERDYPTALEEIRRGRKDSHWMWYIFPQLRGLGHSNMAWHYGIEDLEEARAYLAHPVLGKRLLEITGALLEQRESDPVRIFGWTDSLKLRSCLTLFSAAGGGEVFDRALERFYAGQRDGNTLELLKR